MDEIGLPFSDNVFLGRDLIQLRGYAGETGLRLDQAVAELVEQARSSTTLSRNSSNMKRSVEN